MPNLFIVKGINPATGKVVQITLAAATQAEAKAHAESAGLQKVTVTPATDDVPPKG